MPLNDFNNIQDLLEKRNRVVNDIPRKPAIKPLKARGNASLDDFIEMVSEMVSKSLKKDSVVFLPDEGAVIKDPQKKLEQPTIMYQVISREPKLELKPRPIETIVEDIGKDGEKRFGQSYSQRQKCIVQFDVVASDYATANRVMNNFEDMMATYTSLYKAKGVSEIYFQKYYTDTNMDKYRQWLSVRSIQFYVEIEKLITIYHTTVKDIDS